jgi:hypothetical protein
MNGQSTGSAARSCGASQIAEAQPARRNQAAGGGDTVKIKGVFEMGTIKASLVSANVHMM